MKAIKYPIYLFTIVLLLAHAFCFTASAAGLLQPKNSTLPALEIQEHHVDVQVDGMFVTTSVTQVFSNPNNIDLEAIYSFPVPKGTAVGEFMYWINEQAVIGEVVEKQQARQIYESEKAAGRDAAIVEQNEFKDFSIAVTPVLANQSVKLKLTYVQKTEIDTSIGRYVYPLENGGTDEEQLAFWERKETVKNAFSFNLSLRSTMPADAIRLPAHKDAIINKITNKEWTVSLQNASDETSKLDKDIVVYWRLEENLPASIDVVAHRSDKNAKGTFMLTLHPSDELSPITQGRDWIFVLDVSGSMQGKYAALVEGVRKGINRLPKNDRFQVIAFNDNAIDLSGGFVQVSESRVEQVLQKVQSFTPDGGTNLYAGLENALDIADADRPTAIMLVTDGVANVGLTAKKDFRDLLQTKDVRLFSFIMGNGAQLDLLEQMAKVSNGFSMSISNSDDISGQIMFAAQKLSFHSMQNVNATFTGAKISSVLPKSIGAVYRGQQLVFLGHYFAEGEVDVEISAEIAGEKRTFSTKIDLPSVRDDSPEIERLWGFAQIKEFEHQIDYFGDDSEFQQAIINTAIEYGLVSNYTSMIVLQEDIFDAYNIQRTNKTRVEKEQQARAQRNTSSTQKQQQNVQPAFNGNQPSSGGGGSFGFVIIAILVLVRAARFFTSK